MQRYIARKTEAGWVVAFGKFNETKDAFMVAYETTQGSDPRQFTIKTYDPPPTTPKFSPWITCMFCEHGPWPMSTRSEADPRYLDSAAGINILETRQLYKSFWRSKIQPPQVQNRPVEFTVTY